MNYKVALHTDVGIQKETNQDSCSIKIAATNNGNILLALMCDGMGGLSKGEVASASLIRAFSEWFSNDLPLHLAQRNPIEDIKLRWDRIIKEQNQIIAAYGRSLHIQLGSTITALIVLEDGKYLIAHVGDSRAYKITDNSISALTEDQTVVVRDVKQGKITAEEAELDPRRNVLLQCVGASRIVEPVFYYGTAGINECYMLCSDGFRHVVSSQEIQTAFSPSNNMDENIMKKNIVDLIELNKSRNENDNITALLIKIE